MLTTTDAINVNIKKQQNTKLLLSNNRQGSVGGGEGEKKEDEDKESDDKDNMNESPSTENSNDKTSKLCASSCVAECNSKWYTLTSCFDTKWGCFQGCEKGCKGDVACPNLCTAQLDWERCNKESCKLGCSIGSSLQSRYPSKVEENDDDGNDDSNIDDDTEDDGNKKKEETTNK